MQAPEILQRNLCEPNLKARNKNDVLAEIASILQGHSELENFSSQELTDALHERENLGSTGFGDGIAIPHCRLPGVENFVLGIGISRRGVNFDALDGKSVHLFCFLAGPEEKPDQYVKILAEISVVLRNEKARKELTSAKSDLALYESYRRYAEPGRTGGEAQEQKLLMLVLQEEKLVNDVMQIFLEMGIRGASVLETKGMGQILTNVPLFASFMNFLGGQEEFHRTIFAIVPDAQLPRLIDAIEERTGDLDNHTGAMATALDISLLKGSMEAI